MKYILLITLVSYLVLSCGEKITDYDKSLLLKSGVGNRGIIISCIRCGCIDEFISSESFRRYKKDIPVVIDSTCKRTLTELPSTHLSQILLDSIYEKNYNMIFFSFDSKTNSLKFKLIKTDDNFFKELKSFF